MPGRVNRRQAVIGAVSVGVASAAVAAVAVLPGAASAALPADGVPAPTAAFLTAAELPQGPEYGPWRAHAVRAGVPKPQYTCIRNVLPAARTVSRTYTSDLTGEARELVATLPTVAGAKLAAKEVSRSIGRCAAKVGEHTTWTTYGHHPTGDGLAVYGVFFAPAGSEYHLQMYGVGRDGRHVVVVALSQQGRKPEAPVVRFTRTAKKALTKAF